MSRRHIYIIFCVLLVAAAIMKNKNFYTVEEVKDGTQEGSYPADWYSVISDEVNKDGIQLVSDGKAADTAREQILMDEEGHFLIPVSVLTDAFFCSARIYDGVRLVIEKNAVRAEILKDSDIITVNGTELQLECGFREMESILYLPAEAVEKSLSYRLEWNAREKLLTMISKNENERVLPYAYDYRKEGRAPRVKNQGTLGTCWAFASLMALESRLLPEEDFDFSQDHMSIRNSFHMTQNDGGEYTMSMAYLLAWQGPALQSQDPYGDGISPDGVKPSKHVQDIEILPEKDYEAIKEAVYFYGGVQSSLYTSMVTGQKSSQYYNKEKGAYCYIGLSRPNHDIVIIGWDDNYPKENFPIAPEGDGAFICANSWGGEFGEEGYFYVSYYDTNIGIHNILYKRVDPVNNYDEIYQTDLCGWVGQLGYGKENACFANVYAAKEEEELTAVGFYATGGDTEYEIYTVTGVNGSDSFAGKIPAAKGTVKNSGYYTIDLDKTVRLKAGERFAVIVSIRTPGSVHPVAIEYNAPDKKSKVDLSDGEGYISYLGSVWERVEDAQNCNVCLKAYTRKVK